MAFIVFSLDAILIVDNKCMITVFNEDSFCFHQTFVHLCIKIGRKLALIVFNELKMKQQKS